MKFRLPILSFLSLLLLSSVGSADSLSNVEAIVTKARAYIGSEDALNSVQAIQYRGTVTLYQGKDAEGNEKPPMLGQAILSFEKPYRQKIEFVFENQSLVTGFNGYEGYEYVEYKREQGEPLINIRSIGGDELRRNKAAAVENLKFFRPFKFTMENAKDRGLTDVDGKQARQIDFIHNGKFLFSRFFDVSNGDLLKTVLDTGMVTIETGEMKVDGIQFSSKTMGMLDGELKYEMVFDEILLNPEYDSSMFDYPML